MTPRITASAKIATERLVEAHPSLSLRGKVLVYEGWDFMSANQWIDVLGKAVDVYAALGPEKESDGKTRRDHLRAAWEVCRYDPRVTILRDGSKIWAITDRGWPSSAIAEMLNAAHPDRAEVQAVVS